jgi:hypothetical protein
MHDVTTSFRPSKRFQAAMLVHRQLLVPRAPSRRVRNEDLFEGIRMLMRSFRTG